ncbi:MAG: hypothetical protein WAJ94_10650 [Candidatus Cybelea sp.]
MRIARLSHYAFSSCAAVALLAGCGGSQRPIGAGGAIPQAEPAHAIAETSSGALIYSANDVAGYVTTYTYPGGSRVGGTSVPGAINECVDSTGDVFVAATTGTETDFTGQIYELAKGSLVATLPDPHWWIGSCAVNPKTGDLAVSGDASPRNKPGVTFFRHGDEKRTVLYTSPYSAGSCAYDPAGNLYVGESNDSGGGLLRLAAGGKKFEMMKIDTVLTNLGTVQWADNHLIVSSHHNDPTELYLYQLSVKGNKATTVRTTKLHTYKYRDRFLGQVWVQGNTVLGYVASSPYKSGHIGLWPYPGGRLLHDKIDVDAYLVSGLAVAPGE